jgi:hypothetical protein
LEGRYIGDLSCTDRDLHLNVPVLCLTYGAGEGSAPGSCSRGASGGLMPGCAGRSTGCSRCPGRGPDGGSCRLRHVTSGLPSDHEYPCGSQGR